MAAVSVDDLTVAIALTRKIARALARRLPADVEVDDLVGAGLVGVAIAAQRYQPGPASFASYARRRIYGEMIEVLRERDILARGSRKLALQARATRRALAEELGRQPSDEQLGARLGVSARVARDRERLLGIRSDSLEAFDDSDARLASRLPTPEDAMLLAERGRAVLRAIDQLPERLRRVLSDHMERGLGYRAIGTSLGVTESRACQLHKEAVARLREALGEARGDE